MAHNGTDMANTHQHDERLYEQPDGTLEVPPMPSRDRPPTYNKDNEGCVRHEKVFDDGSGPEIFAPVARNARPSGTVESLGGDIGPAAFAQWSRDVRDGDQGVEDHLIIDVDGIGSVSLRVLQGAIARHNLHICSSGVPFTHHYDTAFDTELSRVSSGVWSPGSGPSSLVVEYSSDECSMVSSFFSARSFSPTSVDHVGGAFEHGTHDYHFQAGGPLTLTPESSLYGGLNSPYQHGMDDFSEYDMM